MSDLDSIFNDDWSADHRSGVIAVVGRPNVGKSTLINYIIGQKVAIVTPTPQTTRRQQLGIYTEDDAQMLFVDTPGIHTPYHKLGEYMVRSAEAALRDVDAILWVVDVANEPQSEDQHIATLLQNVKDVPIVMALNKRDLLSEEAIATAGEPYKALVTEATTMLVSALDGTAIPELLDALIRYLPKGPRYYPKEQVSEVNLRFIASEVVREKIILNTFEEIPHSVAVGIDIFEEKDNGKYEIHATIYVEKDSQKGIIIGSKGSMIKKLGIEARTELEAVYGNPVQLFLHVKVLKNWRSDERSMRRFGYYIPKEDS